MTTDRRLVPGEAEAGGYRPLLAADGEQHLVRDDLTGTSLPGGRRRSPPACWTSWRRVMTTSSTCSTGTPARFRSR
jgi:hypothetical protein